ncbi:hypothetical protein Pfo_029875, partial [Paulownia fortunei]
VPFLVSPVSPVAVPTARGREPSETCAAVEGCLPLLRSGAAGTGQLMFIIWTKSAFEKLDEIYGTFDKPSEKKKGYVLPRTKMVNADLARIINSDEVQSVVKPIKKEVKRAPLKKNPLKNLNVMLKLNPYAKAAKRMALLAEAQRVKAKQEKLDKKRKQITKVLLSLHPFSVANAACCNFCCVLSN